MTLKGRRPAAKQIWANDTATTAGLGQTWAWRAICWQTLLRPSPFGRSRRGYPAIHNYIWTLRKIWFGTVYRLWRRRAFWPTFSDLIIKGSIATLPPAGRTNCLLGYNFLSH